MKKIAVMLAVLCMCIISFVASIAIWYLVSGLPKLAGWMAAGGVITMVNNYIMKQQLKTSLIGAYDQFKNMTDAYCENDQLKSIRLSNGNECVKTSNQTFACKFSVE